MESNRSKYILAGLTAFCILLIGITSLKDGIMEPLRTGVGYFLIPIQSGVNKVGTGLFNEIIDYGKYRYELARKEKEARKKQKVIDVKEVRLSPNIDTNDLNTKVGAARKFLEKGDKVKVTLRFRGREMAHMSKSKYILDDFAESLADIAVVDKPSKVEGRSMVMFLTAKR